MRSCRVPGSLTFDCDVHLEISDSPSKTAPRVIVETPIDSEYCDSRKILQHALAQHHFQLRYIDQPQVSHAELPQALPYLWWAWHFAISSTTAAARKSELRGNCTRRKSRCSSQSGPDPKAEFIPSTFSTAHLLTCLDLREPEPHLKTLLLVVA